MFLVRCATRTVDRMVKYAGEAGWSDIAHELAEAARRRARRLSWRQMRVCNLITYTALSGHKTSFLADVERSSSICWLGFDWPATLHPRRSGPESACECRRSGRVF